VHLQRNFRQADQETALYHNVVKFSGLREESHLRYDDSFRLEMMDEQMAEKTLIEEAVRRCQAGESIQVLSPYNIKTKLSVRELNRSLQKYLNPAGEEKKELEVDGLVFRDGDRVIITKNDYEKNCVNGDVGVLRIDVDSLKHPAYHVELEDGRCPEWNDWSGLAFISHAYALTVHKSQGSQYDTILFPVVERFNGMLYRNLLYTAISRAKKQVILYGSKSSLNVAVCTPAKPRRSMLVAKTQMILLRKAV
jgi:exodeoxyribonuclease V alpha subunit